MKHKWDKAELVADVYFCLRCNCVWLSEPKTNCDEIFYTDNDNLRPPVNERAKQELGFGLLDENEDERYE